MTRHRFDAFSFLAGAIAVTVGVLVLLDVFDLRVVDLRVIGPVIVLSLGLALLVGGGRERGSEVDLVASPGDPADADGPTDRSAGD
jgi:small neutral amino acid transporter SnatA (MarC family)